MSSKFRYNTIEFSSAQSAPGIMSNSRAEVAKAVVKSVTFVLSKIQDWGISRDENQEIEKLSAEIERRMPPNGGVLICSTYQEWQRPDENGYKAKQFLALWIAGQGADYNSVLGAYLSLKSMEANAVEDCVRRTKYFWITK